ncbi:DUF5994 family protein [Streptomyces sp. NPDC008086]|uniref:DUF5994 family protein n=1 Tax=Streptomyces sp. NPDC008086 TaxID=3364807 RepID=UPI0036E924A6
MRPPTFPPGPVSGAWWTRSDDLSAELSTLIAAFDPPGENHGRRRVPLSAGRDHGEARARGSAR